MKTWSCYNNNVTSVSFIYKCIYRNCPMYQEIHINNRENKTELWKCSLQDEQEPEGDDLVDSEEYEEDEEEDRHRKKRKKDSRYGGFIIDEAEVSYNLYFYANIIKRECKFSEFVCIYVEGNLQNHCTYLKDSFNIWKVH